MKRAEVFFLFIILFSCSNKDDVSKLNFLNKGNQAYNEGNSATAIRFYNEAIAIDSSFVDAWNNRGLAEMSQNLNDEAIYSFNQALFRKPDYALAQLNYVKANLAVGQYYASLDGLEALNKLWPDSSIIYFTRGLVYHEMDEDSLALANFETARIIDPANNENLVNIANIHYQNEDYTTALEILKDVISQDADNSHAYNILAMSYSGLGDNNKASDAIDLAQNLEPEDPYILNNKGYILTKLARYDEADKLIVQSMKRDPYNGWVYRNLGLLRQLQGKSDEAERLLGKAFDMDPTIDNLIIDYFNILIVNDKKSQACELKLASKKSKQLQELKITHCNN